jgi:hypothetical protein
LPAFDYFDISNIRRFSFRLRHYAIDYWPLRHYFRQPADIAAEAEAIIFITYMPPLADCHLLIFR